MDIVKQLSEEFGLRADYAKNIVELIDDGNTIPFIARYRKEMHGSCNDQVLRDFSERLAYLRNLGKRKEEVLSAIGEQGKLTDELSEAIAAAKTLAEVEDLYRPYKQKRRTRATVAKEKGLEPLAEIIFDQQIKTGDISEIAAPFISEEKEVGSVDEAVAGASDIIAEIVSDNAEVRKKLKNIVHRLGTVVSSGDSEKDSVYRNYYDYSEPVEKIPSHRILAILRGENEEMLKVRIDCSDATCLNAVYSEFVKEKSIFTDIVKNACADSWQRLLQPSIEREIRNELRDRAYEQAVKMFGLNLRHLLMQPPVKDKVVLAVDPAYRTGCKIAVVDSTGKVLDTGVIYPTPPQNKTEEAEKKILAWIKKFGVDCISIGNGTASKEAEIFIANTIGKADRSVSYAVVNEAGASVYSASRLGAEEFPDFDVSVRSAVSIARRLQDPLAELVKIDPKSIGVGQYQHDVPPAQLDEALRSVVEDCVNSVGVDLNTASPSLLFYVSGLSASVAKNIVLYREENGSFRSRAELRKVPKLGPKAFEQCAGFLRIPGAENELDNTSVHPESYECVRSLLGLFGYKLSDISSFSDGRLRREAEKFGKAATAEKCGVGLPTLEDILNELEKPGRDIRDDLPAPLLRTDVMDINDLKPGMQLKGTVRNVIDFGVFVDIGVHQDGLVHISEISNKYIKHPSEVLSVGDVVNVTVLSVDPEKKRISLSVKKKPEDIK
ncbi:MAG: RNA-binding transcriptional accessory protein [Clostridiales bacterium]|nr:RNA-binding transcriptional accessory protein [Clostridiales bacterium]